MSTAGGGLASLSKSQAGFGGLRSGGGGSMAVHSRGDEAFMDHSASATLDAHRVTTMIVPVCAVSD